MLERLTGLKARIQDQIADSVAGQEHSWNNALSRWLAGSEYQPIASQEVARTIYRDEYYDWNKQVRILGININRVAQAFRLAQPNLDNDMIAKVKDVIKAAVADYNDLKSRDRSNDPDKLVEFKKEIKSIMDKHGLYILDSELLTIAAQLSQ